MSVGGSFPRALALIVFAGCAGARRDAERAGPRPTVTAEPTDDDADEAVRDTPCGRLRSERRCLVGGVTAMGVDRGEAHFEERPPHAARVGRMIIDRREVSVREWRQCVRARRCVEAGCAAPSERSPVRCVSWQEARSYCAYRRGRLPSEAEWERAARGLLPARRIYPWGDALPDAGSPIDRTDEGVHDLGGSLAEWTEDGGDFYPAPPEIGDAGSDAAADASGFIDGLYLREDAVGPANSPWRVVRGGDEGTPLAERVSTLRRFRRPDDRLSWVGLRCVYTPP